jgi:hypothetical protein
MKKDDLVVPTDALGLLFGLWIFFVAIFAANRFFLSDPDTYWHIATGRWILVERAFPRHDIFSHTAAGQPWVNMEWLAQIMLAWTYNWLGWGGLILLCGLLIALTFVLLYALLARELNVAVALRSHRDIASVRVNILSCASSPTDIPHHRRLDSVSCPCI